MFEGTYDCLAQLSQECTNRLLDSAGSYVNVILACTNLSNLAL